MNDDDQWADGFNAMADARPSKPSIMGMLIGSRIREARERAAIEAAFEATQALAVSVTPEQYRVRVRPTVRWRWGINWRKVAALQVAASMHGAIAARRP